MVCRLIPEEVLVIEKRVIFLEIKDFKAAGREKEAF